jgi:serine/threonine-protein kinase
MRPVCVASARGLLMFALCLLSLLGLAGCEGSEGQLVRSWTLRAPRGTSRIELPAHVGAELAKEIGDYRITTEVVLDDALRGDDVDLVIPYLCAAASLRAGGEGVPSAARADGVDGYRHVGPYRWTIPRSAIHDGRVSLELVLRHVWTQSAWLDVAPRLVRASTSTPVMRRNRALNGGGGWFGLIGLSQMGFVFLAVFFWDRKRRSYLWFAIQALTASYYPAYVLGLTVPLGPQLDNLLLAESMSIAPIISVYFTHEFFGRGRPNRLWLVLLGIAALTALTAVGHAFVRSDYATPGVVVCVGASIVYQLATGTRLLFTYADRTTGLFHLCCWLALGGSSWVDLFAWLGGGEVFDGARPACIGLGLFGMFQSMLLSRSHFRSLAEADRLNTTLSGQVRDLEERQAEIEALNEELRQQVGRRSAHILSALTQAESAGVAVQLEPGEVVEDRYRVIGALGSGGMGTVYEVERLHDHRRLALKVTLETRGFALARLAREAQIATRVRHPNVVAVVDTDVAKAGYVYLVMELVEGCSLADVDGRRDVRWCLNVLVQVLEGMSALHAQGIVHRDLKPANVLLTGDIERAPAVKLTDFGISRGPAEAPVPPPPAEQRPEDPPTIRLSPRATEASDHTDANVSDRHLQATKAIARAPQLTRTGAISGTPSYVAPELAKASGAIAPPVDVFSFGVVAYRLFTGTPPHAEAPLLARIDGREPKPHVPFDVPLLPKRVARLLDACLSFAPESRPGTTKLLRVLWEALEDTKPEMLSAEAT